MFEKVLTIYNEKQPERKQTKMTILKRKLVNGWVLEGLCSYQYGQKMIKAVDAGNQVSINWKILKYTAEFCGISMTELFEQF